jgi:hypothetical protein
MKKTADSLPKRVDMKHDGKNTTRLGGDYGKNNVSLWTI